MAREIEKEAKKMALGMRGQRRYRATENGEETWAKEV
jgi:hypothetical protein